jgi:hypothetical protein
MSLALRGSTGSLAQHLHNRSAMRTPQRIATNPQRHPPHRVTAQEAAGTLEKSAEAVLLEAKDEAIADLRDRVAFLERQLEDRAEEIRRRDHIIAAITERIPPAIEAPDHEKPPRAPENTAEEPARATPSDARGPKASSAACVVAEGVRRLML